MVPGCYEATIEPLGIINGREFFAQLSEYLLATNDATLRK